MIDNNSKTANILIVNNDDNLIPALESEIKGFGHDVTSVRSFTELYKLNLKLDYNLIILTDFGLLSNDLISCVSTMRQHNLLFLILVRPNNLQLIDELSNLNIPYLKFPIKRTSLFLNLGLLLTPEKYILSEKQKQLLENPEEFEELNNMIKTDFRNYKKTSSPIHTKSIVLFLLILFSLIIFISKWFLLIYLVPGILLFTITQYLKLSKARHWIGDLISSIIIWPVMLVLWDQYFKKVSSGNKKTYL